MVSAVKWMIEHILFVIKLDDVQYSAGAVMIMGIIKLGEYC